MTRHCSLTLTLALLNLLLAAPISAAPAAGRLPLLIENATGTDRQAEPVTTGVPLAKGRFRDVGSAFSRRSESGRRGTRRCLSGWF